MEEAAFCIEARYKKRVNEGDKLEERLEARAREWRRVEDTPAFRELIRSKKAFIIPATIFFVIFYFTLPILTAFTTVLNFRVVGALTGAYVYAFAQFAMTWILAHLYLSRANKWDAIIDRAREEAAEGKEA